MGQDTTSGLLSALAHSFLLDLQPEQQHLPWTEAVEEAETLSQQHLQPFTRLNADKAVCVVEWVIGEQPPQHHQQQLEQGQVKLTIRGNDRFKSVFMETSAIENGLVAEHLSVHRLWAR